MTDQHARPAFSVGQIICHRKYDYRGVIVDVDPVFQGTEEWYEQMAVSRPPKDKPWYHVLVDGAEHSTYVAEQHLEPDPSGHQISHPALGQFFDRFERGRYFLSSGMH
jgi:heat shock protein HspQ